MMNDENNNPDPILLPPLRVEDIKAVVLMLLRGNCGRKFTSIEIHRFIREFFKDYMIGEDRLKEILKELVHEKRVKRESRGLRHVYYYVECEECDGGV